MTAGRTGHRGFTLIELLVVMALIAGLSAFLLGGLRGNQPAALRSAQATLANLLTAARTRAMASGCGVRLLIHADPSNAVRFRRMIAMQQESPCGSGNWALNHRALTLPEGVIVLPYKSRIPAGLFENPAEWVKTSTGGSSENGLHSSSLSSAPVSASVLSATGELWDVIQFTPNNTMSVGGGDVVLAAARVRPPGSYAAGESPVRADSPNAVRGVSISTYGVPALIDSRGGF